jgi:hypothetical protein
MKKLLVIMSMLIVAAACAAPPTNRDANTSTNRAAETTSAAAMTEAEAIAKEKAVWETLKKKDYDAFGNMLASDYIEVGDDGVYDKAGIVTYLKDLDVTDVTFADWKMVPINKDAALLLYNVTLKGKFKGKDVPPGPYRASSVWVNRDGKWQAIYYQETMARTAPPPPAAAASPAATSGASPAAKTAEVTTPVDPVEREKMIWDLLKRRDYDAFAAFLDDAQIEVEPDGVYDKAGTLKAVRSFDASRAELSEFKTVKLGDDASLVTYHVTLAGPKPEHERATTLWVQRGGKWLALFHQGTPVSTSDTTGPAAATTASPKASPTY